jgi:hypothetical protein
MLRVYVPATTRILLIAGVSKYEEAEFLLRNNTQFYITRTGTVGNTKMKITDIVVIM